MFQIIRYFILVFSIWVSFNAYAQLKFHYQNDNLNIPDWLTNPAYIAENEDEEKQISIDEEILGEIHSFSVVKIRMNEDMFNYGTSEIYLGTFNKSLDIIDITYVAAHSSSDWNWTGEAYFECIKPDIYKYFYTELKYRSAENEEEQASSGGMILSSSDTTIEFFKINPDGTIFSTDDIESFEESDSENNKEEIFDEDACILQIRASFIEINKNAASFSRKNKSENQNIALTLLSDKNSLRKIIATYKKEKLTEEYYFNDQSLIFLFSSNKTNKEENRYYFHNNHLFRWLKGVEKLAMDKECNEFIQKENEFLQKVDKFKNG
jgi:hypothetical protein